MARKTKKKPMRPLAVFLQDELDRRNMTQEVLAERSGLPLSTVQRIVSGAVAEPRGSQVSLIAYGLGMEYWELANIMGIGTGKPGSPEQEAAQMTTLIERDPGLRQVMHRVMQYSPKNRNAVLAYMQTLERLDDPPAP